MIKSHLHPSIQQQLIQKQLEAVGGAALPLNPHQVLLQTSLRSWEPIADQ